MCNAKSNVIKIVMTSDKNYILQSKVTLWSVLMASSDDYIYEVNVLCSALLEQNARNKLIDIEKKFNNVKVNFVEIGEELFSEAKVTSFYTLASYYRLIITEVIEGDKCLFLDGDMIVNTDISKLYNIDIEDNLLAAVLDSGVQDNLDWFEEHRKKIDVPSMENYVNAGVMIWNLKKLREINIHKEFMKHIHKGYPYMDNDILNKCCYSKIYLLEHKYNLFSEFLNKPENIRDGNKCRNKLTQINENDAIIHYAGWIKPWNILRSNGADLWWQVAKRSLEGDDYLMLKKNAEDFARNTDWSEIVNCAKKNSSVIIFGYSQIGRDVCTALENNGVISICGFCDNDKEKHMHQYGKYKVNSVEYFMNLYPDSLWVVTSQNYHRQIIQQLKNMGISSERIMRYINKDFYYFRLLDDKYIEHEKNELESFNRS